MANKNITIDIEREIYIIKMLLVLGLERFKALSDCCPWVIIVNVTLNIRDCSTIQFTIAFYCYYQGNCHCYNDWSAELNFDVFCVFIVETSVTFKVILPLVFPAFPRPSRPNKTSTTYIFHRKFNFPWHERTLQFIPEKFSIILGDNIILLKG